MSNFIDRVALALYEAENRLTFEASPDLEAHKAKARELIVGTTCGETHLVYDVLKQLALIADENDIDIVALFEKVQDEQYMLANVGEFDDDNDDEDSDNYGFVPDGDEDDLRY